MKCKKIKGINQQSQKIIVQLKKHYPGYIKLHCAKDSKGAAIDLVEALQGKTSSCIIDALQDSVLGPLSFPFL